MVVHRQNNARLRGGGGGDGPKKEVVEGKVLFARRGAGGGINNGISAVERMSHAVRYFGVN